MKKIGFIIFVCVLLVGTSCKDKTAIAELDVFKANQEVENQNKLVVQRYWEGKWNERSLEILDELQTPDVVYHGTSMEMNGIEEYKQVFNSYLTAIHDSHVEIKKLIADGNLVMSYATIDGVNKGELDGLPPTGNKISTSLFTIFRLVDGKIAEEWEIMDELGLMSQLGLELQMKK